MLFGKEVSCKVARYKGSCNYGPMEVKSKVRYHKVGWYIKLNQEKKIESKLWELCGARTSTLTLSSSSIYISESTIVG